MFRDEETETGPKHLPDGEQVRSDQSPAPEFVERSHKARPQGRPLIRPGTMKPQSEPRPLIISTGTRRIPSYPDWEKPPSAYVYPRLRSQEVHRPLKPLLFVAVAVALVAALVLAFSALTGHGGAAVVATGSANPSASQSGGAGHTSPATSGSITVTPSPSGGNGTPGPQISYQQYKVLAGDSISKVAGKFHLKTWELLLANPQIKPPAYTLLVNTYLNIPQPGQLTLPPATPGPSATAS